METSPRKEGYLPEEPCPKRTRPAYEDTLPPTPAKIVRTGDSSKPASGQTSLSDTELDAFESQVSKSLFAKPDDEEKESVKSVVASTEVINACVNNRQWDMALVQDCISPLLAKLCYMFRESHISGADLQASENIISKSTKIDFLLSCPHGEVVFEIKDSLPDTLLKLRCDVNGIFAQCRAYCQARQKDGQRVFGVLTSSLSFVMFYTNHTYGRLHTRTVSRDECILALIRLLRNPIYFTATPVAQSANSPSLGPGTSSGDTGSIRAESQ
eukprot:Rmarinus@m.13202